MDDEKMGPKEFSESVFDALDNLIAESESLVLKPPADSFPWQHAMENQHGAEEQVAKLYLDKGFKTPRFAWAPSPAAMFTAVNMLRSVQAGQRHKFIEALVPVEDPIASAKRALLDAVINRDITVTMGAGVAQYMTGRYGNWSRNNSSHGSLRALDDLARHLAGIATRKPFNPFGVLTPATFDENLIWPAWYSQCIGPLANNSLCFLPYIHICWLCRSPVRTVLYENNHLAEIEFSDGYSVTLSDPEADESVEAFLGRECHHSTRDCACDEEPLQLGDGGIPDDDSVPLDPGLRGKL